MSRGGKSSRQKRLQKRLELELAERDKAFRDALTFGTGVMKGGKHVALQDALRNVRRTTERALDEAGVPEQYRGAEPADWDMDEDEGRFWK